MKKHRLFLIGIVLTSTSFLQAQTLYGDCYSGGASGYGVVFNYNTITGKDSVNFSFNGTNGNSPYYSSGLLQAIDGMLYGTTSLGGTSNKGVLYMLNPMTGHDTVLLNFDGAVHGATPYGTLIQGKDGLLYGITSAGGDSSYGVLYSYDPVKLKDSVRVTLNKSITQGKNPYASLLQASDGFIYGVTSQGGLNKQGIIFRFNPETNNDTALFSFAINTAPKGGLIQGTDGLLYGMTVHGGTSNAGTIYSYDPVKYKDSIRVNMDGTKGEYPWGSLVQAPSGKMYGLTYNDLVYNGGALFSFNPINNNDSVLMWLKPGTSGTGSNPYGSPIIASNGLVYFLTAHGAANGNGTLISYNPKTGKDTILVVFNASINGATASGNLLEYKTVPTSLNNIALQKYAEVYPNPFHATTHILFTESGIHILEVNNIAGREIEKVECIGMQYDLQCNGFSPGIYFIKVFDQEQKYIAVARIVIE